MIIDFFTGIGDWPFRKLKHRTADMMIDLLKKEGIDKAVIYSIYSILAKDCMEGNLEITEAASKYPETIIPYAVINPAFPCWKRDFVTCFDKMGFKGLRLFPTYHGYDFEDSCFSEIMAAAEEKKIPVVLSVRIEDERQHHWLMKVPPLNIKSVVKVISDFPKIPFIISGASYSELLDEKEILLQNNNWFFDIARMQGRNDNPGAVEVVVRAINDFGTERMLFGSNAPFQYVKSSLLKVQNASISEKEKMLILSGNAGKLLDIME